MNRIFIIAIAVATLLPGGCSRRDEDQSEEASIRTNAPARMATAHDAGGTPVIMLDRDTQKRMNLETTAVEATNMILEVQAYGRVLNPIPLFSLASEISAARATVDASQKELERIKTLAGQNNASTHALESAEAEVARDEASAAAARQKLLGNWGAPIARRADLQSFAESLANGETRLVQLNLPAGESLKSPPSSARLVSIAGESLKGQFIEIAPTVDPQLQGQSFLYVAGGDHSDFKPGAAVTGWLQTSSEPVHGVVVPESAVIRHQAKTWVYVETNATNFVRKEVALIQRLKDQDGWLVDGGLQPDDQVVTQGAESLLSEELKSQFQIED